MKRQILSITVLFLFIIIFSCKKDKTPEETPNSNPSCEIISPIEGQEFRKGETVLISIDAEDNDGGITEVRFYVDDIGINSLSSFPYNYTWITTEQSIGIHRIKAASYDNSGNKKTDEISINILEREIIPVANFSSNLVTGMEPLLVNFTDLSENSPTSWLWNFGDGNTSIEQNPSHLYENDGYYNVSLRAENWSGFDTLTKTDYILVGDVGGGEPCPGTPTITYENQTYNTVQLGSQCWLRENLNVGIMIDGSSDMQDNDIIEKYCYNNDESNCDIYGGQYRWAEAMQHSIQEEEQGICPSGWHIPSDDEWKSLEGFLGMSSFDYDDTGWRGIDQGEEMKSTSNWYEYGNGNNSSGFSGLPGGYITLGGLSDFLYESSFWWSSSENNSASAWSRGLDYRYDNICRNSDAKNYGFFIRCIKN